MRSQAVNPLFTLPESLDPEFHVYILLIYVITAVFNHEIEQNRFRQRVEAIEQRNKGSDSSC